MKAKYTFALAIVGLCLPAVSGAQLIASRGELNALLGGGGTTDDFEKYPVDDGDATGMGTAYLDWSTMVNGHGPHLVHSGSYYASLDGTSVLQWNGAGYFGQASKDILSNGATLAIGYTGFVTAMGVDLSAFEGYGDTFHISVYDTNGALIGTDTIDDAGTGGSEFFGWQNYAGGIGSVTFTGTKNTWSPIIDNHTYGDAVPEPASMLALGVGSLAWIVRRRRA